MVVRGGGGSSSSTTVPSRAAGFVVEVERKRCVVRVRKSAYGSVRGGLALSGVWLGLAVVGARCARLVQNRFGGDPRVSARPTPRPSIAPPPDPEPVEELSLYLLGDQSEYSDEQLGQAFGVVDALGRGTLILCEPPDSLS